MPFYSRLDFFWETISRAFLPPRPQRCTIMDHDESRLPEYLDASAPSFVCEAPSCFTKFLEMCGTPNCNKCYCGVHAVHPHSDAVRVSTPITLTNKSIKNTHAMSISQIGSGEDFEISDEGSSSTLMVGISQQTRPPRSQPAPSIFPAPPTPSIFPAGTGIELFNLLGEVLTLKEGDVEDVVSFKKGLVDKLQSFAGVVPGANSAGERPKYNRIACTDAGFGGVSKHYIQHK
jgi:hypothetical protein